MGWVDFKLKEYQSSLGLLEYAYELEKHPEIAAHLGEVLWVLGREDDAKSIWSDAVMKHPSNDVLLETLKRHGVD
jgi:predicted negative regulator of RcsB-dependent stress response